MFPREDSYLQKFQTESHVIFEYFLPGIPSFIQDDDMIFIEFFCCNLENISDGPQFLHESCDFNNFCLVNECCLDEKLNVLS